MDLSRLDSPDWDKLNDEEIANIITSVQKPVGPFVSLVRKGVSYEHFEYTDKINGQDLEDKKIYEINGKKYHCVIEYDIHRWLKRVNSIMCA